MLTRQQAAEAMTAAAAGAAGGAGLPDTQPSSGPSPGEASASKPAAKGAKGSVGGGGGDKRGKGGRAAQEAVAPPPAGPSVLQQRKPQQHEPQQQQQQQQRGSGPMAVLRGQSGAVPGAAAAAPTAGPAQALQSANAALYRLAVETVSVLKQVGLSMLRLGDGEAAAGLHAWASRAFEPLLRLLAQQRSLQLLRRMQATGGPQAGAAAVGEGKVVGDARGGGGVAEAAALPVVDEEDVDLPFGGAKATLPSSSSENKGPCFAPSAHAAASVEAQPLAWLHALSLQALGKYEHAVRQYTTFLQMDAWDPVPQPPVAPDVPPSGTHAGGHASATPTPGPASQSPSQQSQDALAVHSGVRRYVAERLAECYVSVADWGGLHALASEHHGRARADPAGHGVWWGPLAQQMGQHFAMASYDLAPGPAAVDIKVWARMGGAPTRDDHARWPPWDVSGSGVKQALVWKLCI